MKKKFFLIGFLIVMLLGIPAVSYYVSTQKTKVPTKAAKSTNLSFILPADPITPGKTFNVDIQLDPGSNQVSFVRLVIAYNPQKLAPADGNPLTKNDSLFGVLLEGPTTGQCTGNTCTMTIAMGISPDSGKPIQGVPAIIGTVRFKALQATDNAATTVSFATGTQVLSLAAQDAPSENVLSNAQPVSIAIISPSISPSATSSPIPQATLTPSPTPPGTTSGAGSTGAPTTTTNTLTCSSFTANATNGTPPLLITFSIAGAETNNGSGKITKVTVNFGDGTVQDITSNGGIGTGTVSTQISHTYQTAGTYTANATLTDNAGVITDPSTCQQTITIGSSGTSGPSNVSPSTTGALGGGGTPAPTLMKSGPGQTLIGIGIAGGIVAAVGTALILGL